MSTNISLTGIPVYTFSKFRGVGLSPARLRKLGIMGVLRGGSGSLVDKGDLRLPRVLVDTGSPKFRNRSKYVAATKKIADEFQAVGEDDFLINLGGECSLVPGMLAGAGRRFRGRAGIVWLDAHGDFNTPQTTPSGFIGGMCLALACGREPSFLEQVGAIRAPVSEEAVAHLGSRALDPTEEKVMRDSPMMLASASELRKEGIEKAASRAVRFVSDRADWLVMHLDVDFLDPSLMAAVNFPATGGLEERDVRVIAGEMKASGKLRVLDLTAYDPTKDPTSRFGKRIVKVLADVVLPSE